MKRLQRPTRIWFAAALAVAGVSILPSCGGSSGKKDANPPGIDGPPRLDTGGKDGPAAPDRAPGLEVGRLDGGAPMDASPTEANPVEPDVAVPPPDGTTPEDVTLPPVEVGPRLDQATPDRPPTDVPLGDDGPGVRQDVTPSDRPLSDDGRDAPPFIIDAPMIDGAGIDSAPIEAALPGSLTGWPTAALDFGAAPCGGEPLAAKTFTLTNAGGTPVTLTKAKFTGTAYTTDAAGKTVPAGGSLVVSVTAPAVPQTVDLPASYDDMLAIETDIPGDDQHLIPVTESAQGAVLVWDTGPGFGAFGEVAPGHSTSAAFHVINMGNVSVQVALATTGQFTVTSQNPVTIGPRAASDSSIAFAPTTGGGAMAGTLAMSLATPTALCQPLPGPLNLTGTASNGALALSAVALSFASECGGAAPPVQTLTVANTGTLPMTWQATLEAGTESKFQISPTGSTLAPPDGGAETSTVITITGAAATSGTTINDAIVISTDALNDTPHKVALTHTPLGDRIALVGSGTVELGSVPIASPALTSAPVSVTLRNDGNLNSAPAIVTLTMTGPSAAYFSVTPTELSIPAGSEASVSVTFSPGTNPSIVSSGNRVDLSATLHWSIGSEANCGDAAGDVTTNGTATLGQLSGIPGQLDFGLVNCGEFGLQQQFTIVNSGSATYQITNIALVNSTYYAVDYPSLPRTLLPEGSMVVTVTPSQIPATVLEVPDLGRYEGRLTITTDLLGDVPHEIKLLMGARGAIITNPLTPLDWAFGDTSVGQTLNFYVPVENLGNVPVTAALKDVLISSGQAGVFSLSSPAVLPANQISNIVALFQPNQANATFNATARVVLSVASDATFCKPLPAGWNSTERNVAMHGSSLTPAAP